MTQQYDLRHKKFLDSLDSIRRHLDAEGEDIGDLKCEELMLSLNEELETFINAKEEDDQ